MPVEKFRTLEEAERALRCRPAGRDLARRVAELWHRAGLLAGRRYPSGVRKYPTLDEAEADRLRWGRGVSSDHEPPGGGSC